MLHEMRWTVEKISQRIPLVESYLYRRREPLPTFRYRVLPGPGPLTPVDMEAVEWAEVPPRSQWGGIRIDFVLKTQFQVPVGWEAELPVALYLPLGIAGDFSHPEALAYIDDTPIATIDRFHYEIQLPDRWRDGKVHRLALRGWTGFATWDTSDPSGRLLMGNYSVVQIDQPTRDFLAAARVALGITKALDPYEPARARLLNALNEAFKILDLREPVGSDFYASIPQAYAVLRAGIEQAGTPLDVTIVATGHAHLDVAWLWTLRQIREKASRTFHTVIRLMEQFPDFHFAQSQPQLYDFIREDYPELFANIQERVSEGRWEPIGGMWVEADCNLTGPESLARQFLLGRSFFQEHFGSGAESPVLWLPDVFGYAWALPQLIRQAGLKYFFTIKIGWNQYNRLPYDTFWWQGLDGSRVLTHFSTTPDPGGFGTSTYNAEATPSQALGTWTNFQQKELSQELLMAFGYGDGGGGPNREMLENIRELAAFPASPRLRQGSVGEYFEKLETQLGDQLPTWNGELYLELHRGTYTTQSRNKRANRKSEFQLHDAEFLAAYAALLAPEYQYPTETLREAWRLVCLNQFHDIIPGSSIGAVYVESQKQYAEVRQAAGQVIQTALSALAPFLAASQSQAQQPALLVANPTSFNRSDPVFWPGELSGDRILLRSDGTPVPIQTTPGGAWIDPGDLPPFSLTLLFPARQGQPAWPEAREPALARAVPGSGYLLENAFLRVAINPNGDITQILDKAAGREVLPTGALANQFLAFEDLPVRWDAWDVDIFYDDKVWTSNPATSIQVVENGPLRATLEIRRRILHSEYTQHISLVHNQPRLDFDTRIVWRERHIFLKVAFPVNILSPVATYEVQWGNVQRPTHRNTSWDWARFETCAQKWVDISEGDYGVSLLNDCKYGHDIRDQAPNGSVLRLSLLRAPTLPDPQADQGEHRFAYSLLTHRGPLGEQTIAAAYALNDPLILADISEQNGKRDSSDQAAGLRTSAIISCSAPNIVIETIKQAEDGNGLIVRLYESLRHRGEVTLAVNFELASAWRTNLLEQNEAEITVSDQQIKMVLKPFEIVTLRLRPVR